VACNLWQDGVSGNITTDAWVEKYEVDREVNLIMVQELQNRYLKLSRQEQVHFLLLFDHFLSTVARGYYPEAGNNFTTSVRGMRACNELTQCILPHVLWILGFHTSSYPQDTLIEILYETAEKGISEEDFIWAAKWAFHDVSGD
jgi:hypothetical protein